MGGGAGVGGGGIREDVAEIKLETGGHYKTLSAAS